MAYEYAIEDGDLVVSQAGRRGAEEYRGRPIGAEVVQILPLPDCPDAVVRTASLSKSNQARNVCRCRPDGSVVWQATFSLRDLGTDYFVEAKLSGDVLHVWTWSCYMCRVDIASGEIIERVFTK